MDQQLLSAMIRCYEHAQQTVILLDAGWTPVWSNRPGVLPVQPAFLGTAADAWDSLCKTVTYQGTRYSVTLDGHPEDGLRVLQYTPLPAEEPSVSIGTDVITESVLSLSAACTDLESALSGEAEPEVLRKLGLITLNCSRLYRPLYLQRTLERRRSGYWEHRSIRCGELLARILKEAQSVLRDAAVITSELPEDRSVWIGCDADSFTDAVLVALLLSCPDSDRSHSIHVRLEEQDGQAELTVLSRSEAYEGAVCGSFGVLTGERMLLDAFCEEYGVHYSVTSADGACAVRLTLPPGRSRGFQLSSPGVGMQRSAFGNYELLLARLRYHSVPAEQ